MFSESGHLLGDCTAGSPASPSSLCLALAFHSGSVQRDFQTLRLHWLSGVLLVQ